MTLDDNQIEKIYQKLKHYHDKFLASYGVKLPNLKNGNKYTKDVLTLIYSCSEYVQKEVYRLLCKKFSK